MSQPLFDAIGEVEEHVKRAGHVLLCLDYDGALTHFTETPAQATLSPHMERVLSSLAEQSGISLAIISGRSREDLQSRVGLPGLNYVGNHGLEISGSGYLFVEPTAASHVAPLQELAERLTAKLQTISGTLVEYKGLTISVHYRQVPVDEWEEVRRLVHAALAGAAHPFVLSTGEKVFDIRPRVYWNKGDAINWIIEKLGKPEVLPIYLGDDVTDEDAFVSFPQGITIKVRDSAETAARYKMDGPPEVRKFLEWIDDLLKHKVTQPLAVTAEDKAPEVVVS